MENKTVKEKLEQNKYAFYHSDIWTVMQTKMHFSNKFYISVAWRPREFISKLYFTKL